MLAGAKFLQVVGGRHAGGVEEVFVLAQTAPASFGRLAFGGDAINRGFALVHRDRPHNADLGAELVHQINVGVEAQIARFAQHPIGPLLAKLLDPLRALGVQRSVLRVGPVGPQQHVSVLERVRSAALLRPLAGIHRFYVVDLAVSAAPARGRRVVPVHCRDVIAIGAVLGL